MSTFRLGVHFDFCLKFPQHSFVACMSLDSLSLHSLRLLLLTTENEWTNADYICSLFFFILNIIFKVGMKLE